jgi:probable HAF family extracellular repeat protein
LVVDKTIAASPVYTVQVLPVTPGCQSYTILHALNPRGDVQGVVSCDEFLTQQAVMWHGDGVVELGTFGGPSSYAAGLNARGDVVGYAERPDIWSGKQHIARPFLYRSGSLIDLGTLGGPLGTASAINEAGVIVGACQPAHEDPRIGRVPIRPCMWTGSEVHDLGDLGGPEGYAYDVNSRGWVVGSSTTSELLPSGLYFVEHAFIRDGSGMRDLGTLGGLGSIALSINERGDVVGFCIDCPETAPDAAWIEPIRGQSAGPDRERSDANPRVLNR